jgi:hypothetical protein
MTQPHPQLLEALGALSGLAGALMLAMHRRWSPYGWVAFLVSNAFLGAFAWQASLWWLFAQQAGFTITSAIGIWRWLLQPWLHWDEWRGEHDGRVVMRTKHLASWRGWKLDWHQVIAADALECFHTHPAKALRFVVWGGYDEEVDLPSPWPQLTGWISSYREWRPCGPGFVGMVYPETCHRVARLHGRVSYSIWLRWPKSHGVQLRGAGWPEHLRATE